MEIRDYDVRYLEAVVNIFYQSVQGVSTRFYSEKEKKAWASLPPDFENWKTRLSHSTAYLAFLKDNPVGFITLRPGGYIDVFYVLPENQNSGVGDLLYSHLENRAREAKLTMLYVDASLVARPFFEKRGFAVIRKNRIERSGLVLINFFMQKKLESLSESGGLV